MKKLGLLILFPLMSITISAQKSNPNYFHDLIGFEDSTGITHLFYRVYEPKTQQCTFEDFDGETYTVSANPYQNHIYHLNLSVQSDSIFLRDEIQLGVFCEEKHYNIEKFIFLRNDIQKPVSLKSFASGLRGGSSIVTFHDKSFDIGLGNPSGLNYQASTNSLLLTTPFSEIFIKTNNDSESVFKKTFKFPFDQDSLWDGKGYYDDFSDSLLIDFSVLGVISSEDDVFIGYKDSNLVISYDSGKSLEVIAEDFFDKYPGAFGTLLNNPNSSAFYFTNNSGFTKFGRTSDIIKVRRISEFNGYRWEYDELLKNSTSKRLAVDIPNPGNIYLSDSTKVFFSQDYGDSMDEILEFEEEVTGLYKKPNSDILYVLTRTDLYKVENGQPTSIKQVPVSSKPEPEIPEKITLHQNYPNPFNPSTTIRFDLKESAFTKLTVYDLLGRKVKELVNEVRPAGTNTIQFNASDLASGVYLYRLEAGSYILTKRLTLIK